MTPERWRQVKAILADALECDSLLDRAALVDRSCAGDTLLKKEVESLLAYADDTCRDHIVIEITDVRTAAATMPGIEA